MRLQHRLWGQLRALCLQKHHKPRDATVSQPPGRRPHGHTHSLTPAPSGPTRAWGMGRTRCFANSSTGGSRQAPGWEPLMRRAHFLRGKPCDTWHNHPSVRWPQGNESEHCSIVEVDDSAQTRRTLTADLIRHLLSPSSKTFQSSATFRGKKSRDNQTVCMFQTPTRSVTLTEGPGSPQVRNCL